jgi:hypothetical protein
VSSRLGIVTREDTSVRRHISKDESRVSTGCRDSLTSLVQIWHMRSYTSSVVLWRRAPKASQLDLASTNSKKRPSTEPTTHPPRTQTPILFQEK